MIGRWREHPVLQLGEHASLFFLFLDFLKALFVGMLLQLSWHWPAHAQKNHRQRLQSFLALKFDHLTPPVIAGEILA